MDAQKTTEKAFLGLVHFSRYEWRAAFRVPHLSRSWECRSKQKDEVPALVERTF